ncbi:MAG: OmpP1/FadL family transporter [Bacteroidales bacterium]
MKKNILLTTLLLASTSAVFAQGEADAIRMSQKELTGSARAMGMAGAFGALGGDMSALSTNPAGIGVFRNSEVSATLDLDFINTSTNWNGTSTGADKTKFMFNNLGYVATFRGSGDFSFNVGIAFNRKANFYRTYEANNSNMNSSLTDYIADKAYGIDMFRMDDTDTNFPYSNMSGLPWLPVLGWNSYLFKPYGVDNGNQTYISSFPNLNNSSARLHVQEYGYADEYNFTFGGNYDDMIYFGGALSITDFAYNMRVGYSEGHAADGNFYMENSLRTKGTGFNFNVGMIIRPADFLRLGISVKTPTYYLMTDNFGALVDYKNITDSYIDENGEVVVEKVSGGASTPNGAMDYKMNSPYEFMGSAAFILGKRGILSFEYLMQDYTSLKLKDPDGYEFADNDYIKEDTRAVNTFKVGAEFRVTPQFSLRAGYAYQSSPIKQFVLDGNQEILTVGTLPNYTLPKSTEYITGGFGYRFGQMYADMAVVYKTHKEVGYAYSPIFINGESFVSSDPFSLKTTKTSLLLTLGYKF